MENKIRERRRIRMVKMEFQRNFIIGFSMLVALTAIIVSTIVYVISAPTTTTMFRNSRLVIVNTGDFILPVLFWSSLVSIIVVGIAAVSITCIMTFRIAGPLFGLEKDVAAFASGKLRTSFQVRRKDKLQDLAISLNQMGGNIRQEIAEAKKQAEELTKVHLSEEARDKANALKKALDKFET